MRFYKRESDHEKRLRKIKLRREKAAAKVIARNREAVIDLVTKHLENHANDWSTLAIILNFVTNTFSIQELFSLQQLDVNTFMKDELDPSKKMTREALGSKQGNFHVAFFALGSGARGRPHAHSDVNCVSAVLQGPFTETLYTEEEKGDVSAVAVETRQKGSVVADLASDASVNDKFIHSVGNYDNRKIAYSLHVYGANISRFFNSYYDKIANPNVIEMAATKQIAEHKEKIVSLSK